MLLLGQLLQNGFSLQQAIGFMPVVFPEKTTWFKQVQTSLEAGQRLAPSLATVAFPAHLVAQIELTELQGNLGACLLHLGQLQQIQQKRRKELMGVIAYPCFLLLFLGALIGIMQVYLFPEISQFNPTTTGPSLLQIFFRLIGLLILIISGSLGCYLIYWHRQPRLKRLTTAFKWPFIGKSLQAYYQYCLLFDLATCLTNGLNLAAINQLAQQLNKTSWLVELMSQLEATLNQGGTLLNALMTQAFYPAELRLVIAKGSSLQQMAKEVTFLAALKYDQLQQQLKQKVNWLQPLLFILIGIIIICTYLSILLPLYHTMEGIS
ncbi:bacterial type II secretion system F domain protein [Latilactobacillus graminis DSM 20719]|uniref:Bacterial type II secretion system F domain protein n=2 Tax=Latilactobacillus graminis TaxID=60519 RepID=A0AA89I0R6_9LACO|nr:bacterial type II secretion system F domain protein [Latilactobacillus graminis DSM 20719]